ncbi:hypothetical protein [Falsiroseomonas sp.]|uniref:hypothetical protein n=1 Tax=Falsiroseomonas sp. TaxID=2870721 RepID=UPI003566E7E7
MQWWLNVFFLVNGLWVPGYEVSGWAPRAYASQAECLERRAFAERECQAAPLRFEARWICSPGRPLTEPPQELTGMTC